MRRLFPEWLPFLILASVMGYYFDPVVASFLSNGAQTSVLSRLSGLLALVFSLNLEVLFVWFLWAATVFDAFRN